MHIHQTLSCQFVAYWLARCSNDCQTVLYYFVFIYCQSAVSRSGGMGITRKYIEGYTKTVKKYLNNNW